jgi:hypothetical protein
VTDDMSRGRKSPPFRRRSAAAVAVGKAAGAFRVKVNPDGSCVFEFKPDTETGDVNDFDCPPNPVSSKIKRGSTSI